MGFLQKLFGIGVNEVPTSPDIFSAQGTGGSSTVGGFLVSHEKNAALSSMTARIKTFDEIALNTAIVATALRYFTSLVGGVGWTLKPPPDGGLRAEKYAEAIQMNMDAMADPWYRVVRRASQFKWIGFNIQEMIAERMDWIRPGYIGVGSCEQRPQKTIEQWDLEPKSGKVLGWLQRDQNTADVFPLTRSKCVYLWDDTLTNSPDGVGLMRHIVELQAQLKRLEQLEMWAYQTDLRGIPIAHAPTAVLDDMVAKGRLTREDADKKLAGIKGFIDNHIRNPQIGLLLDSSVYSNQDATRRPSNAKMWDLQLARGTGAGLGEIYAAIDRKNHEIARALGAEQFMLGASGKGSNALSEDKSRNMAQMINSTVVEIGTALRQDYVGFIFSANGWDKRLRPTLLPDAVALRAVNEIVDALLKLAQAGAPLPPNDPAVNQLRAMLHLHEQPKWTPDVASASPNGKKPGEAVQGQGVGESKPTSGPSGGKGPEVT